MTDAQQQVLQKVHDLLGEHFEHVVLIVGSYDEDKRYSTSGHWHGGLAPAIGLCNIYQQKWQIDHLRGGA
jgi:hypothetical protein